MHSFLAVIICICLKTCPHSFNVLQIPNSVHFYFIVVKVPWQPGSLNAILTTYLKL
jgi:hypothetical protein